MLVTTPQTPFQFGLDHLQHVGWGMVILALIRVVWWTRGTAVKAEEVYKQTTNHMPTDLKRQTALLVNLDKNIAILAKGETADISEIKDQD